MSAATVLFALLFYVATAALVAGLAWRIADYARTPAPLKIPTTPAPLTRGGVAVRMAREVIFFESLFKGNLWTWLLGWLFHACLALVLARHLRYFTEPVWELVVLLQPLGILAGFGKSNRMRSFLDATRMLWKPRASGLKEMELMFSLGTSQDLGTTGTNEAEHSGKTSMHADDQVWVPANAVEELKARIDELLEDLDRQSVQLWAKDEAIRVLAEKIAELEDQ